MTSMREDLTKDLMVSAQGGAGYWADVTFPEGVDGEYRPVGSVSISDFDPEGIGNDKTATFTAEEYAAVIDDFAKNAANRLGGLSDYHNRFCENWLGGDYDVADYDHGTADLIAQWALFDGKIIYG